MNWRTKLKESNLKSSKVKVEQQKEQDETKDFTQLLKKWKLNSSLTNKNSSYSKIPQFYFRYLF